MKRTGAQIPLATPQGPAFASKQAMVWSAGERGGCVVGAGAGMGMRRAGTLASPARPEGFAYSSVQVMLWTGGEGAVFRRVEVWEGQGWGRGAGAHGPPSGSFRVRT